MSAQTGLPIVVMTNSHRLVGMLDTSGRRAAEILNDTNTEFIRLHDAVSESLTGTGGSVALSTIVINKPEINICALLQQKHEAAARRLTSYVQKRAIEVYALAGDIQCRGITSLRGSADPVSALKSEFESFFPVTDAQLRCGATEMSVHVALLNRRKIVALHFGEWLREPAAGNLVAVGAQA